ncbi:MAG: DUF4058 family protein [Gemmataceae bacterium]
MPLLDHFHPPLTPARTWESFHALWAAAMVEQLNRTLLPPGYFAETQVHVGSRVEVDVASFETGGTNAPSHPNGAGGVGVQTWVPPAAATAMPAVFPDEVEVQVFQSTAGATLVGAIELVSPRNKDRAEARRAFAAKCASYLQDGVGLVVVDVVTGRHANLHDELIRLLEQDDRYRFPSAAPLYAVAYHPIRRADDDQIDLWPFPLAVGVPLPTVPLPLRGGPVLPLDLEATYTEARLKSRL